MCLPKNSKCLGCARHDKPAFRGILLWLPEFTKTDPSVALKMTDWTVFAYHVPMNMTTGSLIQKLESSSSFSLLQEQKSKEGGIIDKEED